MVLGAARFRFGGAGQLHVPLLGYVLTCPDTWLHLNAPNITLESLTMTAYESITLSLYIYLVASILLLTRYLVSPSMPQWKLRPRDTDPPIRQCLFWSSMV